jgi:hypothetical protein
LDVSADAEQSLLGSIGRVTVSIPVGGPGEVLLPVRGGTEAFAAWSDEPIPRHSTVHAEAPAIEDAVPVPAQASAAGRKPPRTPLRGDGWGANQRP